MMKKMISAKNQEIINLKKENNSMRSRIVLLQKIIENNFAKEIEVDKESIIWFKVDPGLTRNYDEFAKIIENFQENFEEKRFFLVTDTMVEDITTVPKDFLKKYINDNE